MSQPKGPTLRFDGGTLVLEGVTPEQLPPGFLVDPRVRAARGPASSYYEVVRHLHRAGVPYVDEAREYLQLERPHMGDRAPRDYQREAVAAWRAAGRRGVIVLPTGAGKSFVAELCMADASRSTLVIAPTLDLVSQWYDQLRRAFGDPIGLLGGGVHDPQAITVSTYDSAYIHGARYGARFGMLVFDEVHHLCGPTTRQIADLCIAPFRLGLTATLERPDGLHLELPGLVGPTVYRKEITELAGDFLAEYRTEILAVHLSEEDRAAYDAHRATFRDFVDSRGLRLGGAGGWSSFLRESARSREGRAAFRGWRESRRILQGAPAKLRLLESLLRKHRDNRVIVFTNDNATVYAISRALLLPAITHQTDLKERRALIDAFKDGSLPVLVTSRVLNEGVDIPSADVAIVLSGTATVREHVQRLGRILRPQEGKQAVLYELVVAETAEEATSARRRDHAAYQAD